MPEINSPEALEIEFQRPGYDPGKDLFVAEVDKAIAGYVNVIPEPGIGRVVLHYLVPTQCCARDILKELLHHALKRARELGAKVAHVGIPPARIDDVELLAKLGFKIVRHYYEFRLDLSKISLETSNQPCGVLSTPHGQLNLEYRHFKTGEEKELAQIQNRCFRNTWGYNPNTAKDIAWWLEVKGNCPDDIIFVWDKNKPVGYCWTVIDCGDDLSTGKRRGRIYMIGVDPECRNKGIGKKLLSAGLSHLKKKGREIIDVTVDSQNIVAVSLYYSLGFEPWAGTAWYEKIISLTSFKDGD